MTIPSSTNEIAICFFGCSFTSWPASSITYADNFGLFFSEHYKNHFLNSSLVNKKIKILNFANPGNANDSIFYHGTKFLNEQTKNYDKIYFICQLTGMERIFKVGHGTSPRFRDIIIPEGSFNWLGHTEEAWYLPNKVKQKWLENFKDYTPQKHVSRFFSNLLDFQNVLKNNDKVDYRFFLGWDILTKRDNKDENSIMWHENKKYCNINNKLIIDAYGDKKTKEKYNQIDWHKFWFFENEDMKYGGLSNWVQHTLEPEHWYRDYEASDFHPSNHAHEKFCNEVLCKITKEMIQ